ncbi:MAG: 2,3-bisphosphoglycerate-independent phosphoglycerate mutase, partial [Parasporobacterium sp.]|nr:2,3-bisphosphoglycerate-independent phosphoglycerate mutase [Parasporobacterium sp.]
MILDGYGLSDEIKGNAIKAAKTPVMDSLMKECPFVYGQASGLAVGLPEGQMGNSEVGHLNMGAGRVVYQDLTRISESIKNGDFFTNPVLLKAMNNCLENGTDLHIWGLLSDGGVHSHIDHLYGILKMAHSMKLDGHVFIHAFMDGRDTSPTSGINYMKDLAEVCKKECGEIATISGRYYAMDRDNRWDRIEKAYRALVYGEGIKETCPIEAMEHSYAREIYDEFIEPTIIVRDGAPLCTVKSGDSVIFFDFRPDRAREITRTFCLDEFDAFDRGERIRTEYVCFTDYDVTIPNKSVVFEDVELTDTLGQFLAANNIPQVRMAETEKYAHVTFFFNGGVEEPNNLEDRILVPSPKVATYDLQPEMSAYQVCDKFIEAVEAGKHQVIIINFANPDMVGHTGVM